MISRSIFIGAALLAVSVATASSASQTITKDAVLTLADQVERASEQKDVEGIMRHLSSGFVLHVHPADPAKYRRYDYEGYRAYLQMVFPTISNYSYQRSGEVLNVAPDRLSATYSFALQEIYEFRGESIVEEHREVWKLRHENGALKVVSVSID